MCEINEKKKTIINSSISFISLLLAFLPNIIVRKAFINTLGNEMLGLVSVYTNIIGWLSVIDMGVGNAIIYSLYKPFYNEDYSKVNAYINYYKYFYKIVGGIILLSSIVISPIIKFFISEEIDDTLIIVSFILFALNTYLSYMFSYRLCILNVAQESYKINLSISFSRLIMSILQYIILKIYPNLYLYLLIQILVNLIYYILINSYVCKKYNYIFKECIELDRLEKLNLTKNVRSIFIHKIGGLILNSTDNIIISKFLGLSILTIYTNYQIIISTILSFFNVIIGSTTGGIGSLITEGNKKSIYNTFKNMMFLNFWMGSMITISLYNTIEQFIVLWLGKQYTIDPVTLSIIIFNTYFMTMRQSVEVFKSASGIFYQDRYAPICEALINLSMSIYLVKELGLAGVFLGTLFSNLLVVFWVKPYVLYKYLFKRNISEYFYIYFKYTIIGIILLFITNYITYNFKYNYSLKSFIINCTINIVIINIIYTIIFYRSDEFNYFKNIIFKIIQKMRG